ncbi:SH3 domain-containing protein [Tenacibaculum sp. M341]|uniref:SH3 domain-containing protein n=1 Tax=Tenacibaculum sp. M341 TaxID=2530339 RepID=UPI00104DDA97|nr:SH3 domain-containing protein [Tenacibaculum sp. M341]TCI94900.1 SH3 domain-containing protein [Tenacibaculum sp. M341]
MKKSIVFILFITISFFNFTLKKEVLKEVETYKYTMYVTAESGLLCRDKPHGNVIHKFAYGTEVEIVDRTNQKLTITDNSKEIFGEWVKVRINNTNSFGYVFDGYLTSNTHFDLDVEKIAALAPANFEKYDNNKGLLLKGTHNIYDADLNVIKTMQVEKITEIKILSATKFERPKTRAKAKRDKWQDYCEWAKYVKVIYNNKELILFGEDVLAITNVTPRKYDNHNIKFVEAYDFLKKSYTLTEELSDCYSGSYLLIQSEDKIYSFIKSNFNESRLSFGEAEGGCSGTDAIINKDTIFFKQVNYSFQTGEGHYKLKIFNKKKYEWKYILYDDVKEYHDR